MKAFCWFATWMMGSCKTEGRAWRIGMVQFGKQNGGDGSVLLASSCQGKRKKKRKGGGEKRGRRDRKRGNEERYELEGELLSCCWRGSRVKRNENMQNSQKALSRRRHINACECTRRKTLPGLLQYALATLYEAFCEMKRSASGWKVSWPPLVTATNRVRRAGRLTVAVVHAAATRSTGTRARNIRASRTAEGAISVGFCPSSTNFTSFYPIYLLIRHNYQCSQNPLTHHP